MSYYTACIYTHSMYVYKALSYRQLAIVIAIQIQPLSAAKRQSIPFTTSQYSLHSKHNTRTTILYIYILYIYYIIYIYII